MSGWDIIALFLAGIAVGASISAIIVANAGRKK